MKIRIFEVGGAVRDKLMGLTPKDIDFAVEAPSFDAMREEIIRRRGVIFLESPQYFTIRAKVPELGATDFVLCRKDGTYKDGRHPESVEVGTIIDDLARRDFTINAMARDIETRELFDPHGGQSDLCNKQLRFVGEAQKRLEEDKLRAFRAVRFAVTKTMMLGSRSTPEAYYAIRSLYAREFVGVSTERIREELTKMFAANSMESFQYIFDIFGNLGEVVNERGIWFKPTLAQI